MVVLLVACSTLSLAPQSSSDDVKEAGKPFALVERMLKSAKNFI